MRRRNRRDDLQKYYKYHPHYGFHVSPVPKMCLTLSNVNAITPLSTPAEVIRQRYFMKPYLDITVIVCDRVSWSFK